jgi:cytochrome c551
MRSLLFLLPVITLIACAGDDTDGVDGSAVYSANCAACHGADGTGTAAGADLTERAADLTAAEVEAVVRDGVGSMAGFTEAQIDADELTAVAEHVVDTFGN